MSTPRKIIHIDMDAFFASVEQRDHPHYRGKPLVVGGSPKERGAVAAASYEARKFGIHSAMPSRTAYQRCPHLIFVKPRFDVYRAISQQIRAIFHCYTDLVEPLALDEAYLDVTSNPSSSATAIACEIQQQIYTETGLTASAGVSINKFLAKMASGINKPHGRYVIPPDAAEAFVETLPIEKFYGIGAVTAAKMHELGIRTGADLKQWSEANLVQHFGKVGRFYYQIARAQDERPVEPNRVRKSVGAENSFAEDLDDLILMQQELQRLAKMVGQRLAHRQNAGRTLTLKIKYSDYHQITRSKTLLQPIQNEQTILKVAQELLNEVEMSDRKVRLLGITLSNLADVQTTPIYKQLVLDLGIASDAVSRSLAYDSV
jgi:DNA polymerase IV